MTKQETHTLAIVDDHTIVRNGIEAMLLGQDDLKIIGSFDDGPGLFDFLKKEIPDLIILDINLPQLSGIDIAKIVRTQFADIKILMLSSNTDEESITDSIKSGANGFLAKDSDKEEFLEGVRSVLKGEEFFGESVTKTIYKSYVKNLSTQGKLDEEEAKLSERETEIVKLFSEGLLYKEIADRLNISPRTVESHKTNIMAKLELKTTIDLVKYAIKHQIIDL